MKPYLKESHSPCLWIRTFPAPAHLFWALMVFPLFKYQSEGDSATAKICVGLNAEVAISFTDFKNPSIRQVMLINNGTVYQDVGGDGTYDKTFSLSGNAAASQ